MGQFYAIQVDNARPYNVYGGLQDNGVWYGPSNYSASSRWHASGDYPWKAIAGGDGMQVEVDTRSNDLVYTGSQFGFYSRYDLDSGDRISIRPRHDLGERPLRLERWTTTPLYRLDFADRAAQERAPLRVTFERTEFDDDPDDATPETLLRREAMREAFSVVVVEDAEREPLRPAAVRLRLHTLGFEDEYWIDTGLFRL